LKIIIIATILILSSCKNREEYRPNEYEPLSKSNIKCKKEIEDLNLTYIKRDIQDFNIKVKKCSELYENTSYNSYYFNRGNLIVGTVLWGIK